MGFYNSFDPFGGPGLFGIMFVLVFLLIAGGFLFILISGLREWNKNNHSPRLTVPAVLVSRRTHVSRHSGTHHNGMHHGGHASTSYYVTFQVESVDRMEFAVTGAEYGLLVEGDRGKLTFQGTRYLGFERAL